MKQIALVGSPNCGKTTLFNVLTKSNQRTGNWAGVTVEQKIGTLTLGGEACELIDLPGVHMLTDCPLSIDAKITNDYLHNAKPDAILLVLDATQLRRQAELIPQVMATGRPVVIALNMMDALADHGLELELTELKALLGGRLIEISAAKGTGLGALTQALGFALQSQPAPAAGDAESGAVDCSCNPLPHEPLSHDGLLAAIDRATTFTGQPTLTERIDRWLLHPALAIPSFLLVMYLLFMVSVQFGAIFIDFFDIWLGSWVVEGLRWVLSIAGAPDWLIAFVADGIGAGIQLIATFIPVIGALYLCMCWLEDSGYLARAAFVIDGVMSRIGLPGQAFIPLIVGFGCNVPSVMAARSLNSISARLTTIFIAPFMSCSARLSVYVFVGSAFFPEQAGLAIFCLYLLGIIVAVGSAWLLRKTLFGRYHEPSILEMPSYRRPVWRNVFTQAGHRLHSFMMRAGKRIMLVVIVLSCLGAVKTDGSWGAPGSPDSALAWIGKKLTPMLTPIGIGEDNWQATLGLFSGLFAKEVMVGTIQTLYTHEGEDAALANTDMPDFMGDLGEAFGSVADNAKALVGIEAEADPNADLSLIANSPIANLFPSAWAAFCFLAFVLLYAPCVATLGAMQREAGSGWLRFSLIWSLMLSYWIASNLWQLSHLLERPIYASLWFVASTAVLALVYSLIVKRVRDKHLGEIQVVNLT
ncbi:ferrous iron transport protein B [Simiduia sp. 21SJ11W-1]|uniref:ferrous iron transport protein B n=1 Tax=Simiduia sp. 21SJ11W-1 TaxID=2909669 RepID=UPI0020A13625|nr:ferrous iron transport protein B [Simiduia sp. 21SJ11W-1]UTA47187.1 ferrous iron transport protein B [Simiduia sp. 21SJ11W-1]